MPKMHPSSHMLHFAWKQAKLHITSLKTKINQTYVSRFIYWVFSSWTLLSVVNKCINRSQWAEHGPKTGPDWTKNRFSPKHRTEMFGPGPGRSGPTKHICRFGERPNQTGPKTKYEEKGRPKTGLKYNRSSPVGPLSRFGTVRAQLFHNSYIKLD